MSKPFPFTKHKIHRRYHYCKPICNNCHDCDSGHPSLLHIRSTVNTNRDRFITNWCTATADELYKKN